LPLSLVNEARMPNVSGKRVVSIVAFSEASETVALCPAALWAKTLTRKPRSRVAPLHAV
jgi:hypothetical protein